MKSYIIKVYNKTGTFLDTLKDFEFDSISKQINTGLGQLSFNYMKRFDDFNEESLIAFNNRVDLYVLDDDTGSDAKKIYSGYIYDYNLSIKDTDKVVINCLSYASKLSSSILKNGTQIELKTHTANGLTTGAVASSSTLNKIIKAIIDRYRLEAVNPIVNYDSTDIETTTDEVTYTFNAQTYLDALNKVLEFARNGWYFIINADNKLIFKNKSTTANHTFTLGKDFTEVSVEKNTNNIINRVLILSTSDPDNPTLDFYKDDNSSDLYDDSWKIISDNRLSVQASIDALGASTLEKNKSPKIKTRVSILDKYSTNNGYDIELIEPGDTCKFKGFNDLTSRTFSENMQIMSVTLYQDHADLELEELSDSIVRETVKLNKKINETSTLPTDYSIDLIPSGVWHEIGATGEPAFVNSWINHSSIWDTAAFMKDSMGFVHIKGLVKSGITNVVMFTLPAGYRPKLNQLFGVDANDGVHARVDVTSLGEVIPRAAGNTYIGINISFFAEQ